MEDGVERKILEEMAERLVANKREILSFVSKEKEVPMSVINSITKSLAQRGLLTEVYSSETSYAITQRGIKEASRF